MASAPLQGSLQVVQTEFEEDFASLSFASRMLEECGNVRQTQRDTYAGK